MHEASRRLVVTHVIVFASQGVREHQKRAMALLEDHATAEQPFVPLSDMPAVPPESVCNVIVVLTMSTMSAMSVFFRMLLQ